jgi:hypothetical protein
MGDMQGQATESDCHMVEGKSAGNEKQRAATTVSRRRSLTPVSMATLEWLEQQNGYTYDAKQYPVQPRATGTH